MLWCLFTDEQNELNHILGAKYSDIIITSFRAHHSNFKIQDLFLGNFIGSSVTCTHSEGKHEGLGDPVVFFSSYTFIFKNWGKIYKEVAADHLNVDSLMVFCAFIYNPVVQLFVCFLKEEFIFREMRNNKMAKQIKVSNSEVFFLCWNGGRHAAVCGAAAFPPGGRVWSAAQRWPGHPLRLPPPPLILQSFKNRCVFLTFPLLGAVNILGEPTKLFSCAPRLGSLTGRCRAEEALPLGVGTVGLGWPLLALPEPAGRRRHGWSQGWGPPRLNQKSQAASQPRCPSRKVGR